MSAVIFKEMKTGLSGLNFSYSMYLMVSGVIKIITASVILILFSLSLTDHLFPAAISAVMLAAGLYFLILSLIYNFRRMKK
ncbi:MAG: hypothetical protein JW982_07315 [Spirochaetes bacterium]|nr:hypothetical protein [Spirochaetota bacterium]